MGAAACSILLCYNHSFPHLRMTTMRSHSLVRRSPTSEQLLTFNSLFSCVFHPRCAALSDPEKFLCPLRLRGHRRDSLVREKNKWTISPSTMYKIPVFALRQLISSELRQIMRHVYYSSHENFDNGKQGKKQIKWALHRIH